MSYERRKKVCTTVYLDPGDKEDLKKISDKYLVSEAAIIRVALREALKWHENLRPKFQAEAHENYNFEQRNETRKRRLLRLKQQITQLEAQVTE